MKPRRTIDQNGQPSLLIFIALARLLFGNQCEIQCEGPMNQEDYFITIRQPLAKKKARRK